jgi:excisionase family DNA binding protein
MTQQPPFLTARQAAERLTDAGMPVTKETVQRWCREGRLPAIATLGGHYRIRAEDVDAILVGGLPVEAGVE